MGAVSRAAFRPGHCLVGPYLVYVGAGALYVSFHLVVLKNQNSRLLMEFLVDFS